MITLSNNFHNTSVRINANIGDELSPAQIRRSRRALCGLADCSCGGPLGERYGENSENAQQFRIEYIGSGQFYDRIAIVNA